MASQSTTSRGFNIAWAATGRTPSPHSLLLIPVLRNIAARAVVFVRQELARHGDLDAVATRIRLAFHLQVEIDRGHNAVAEFFLHERLAGRAVHHHQLVEPVDQRIGRRHRRAAMGYLVEHRLLGVTQSEQLGRLGGLRLGQFHLPEQRAGDQHRRHAADLFADMLPRPAFLALDIEDFFGEVGTVHGRAPWCLMRPARLRQTYYAIHMPAARASKTGMASLSLSPQAGAGGERAKTAVPNAAALALAGYVCMGAFR